MFCPIGSIQAWFLLDRRTSYATSAGSEGPVSMQAPYRRRSRSNVALAVRMTRNISGKRPNTRSNIHVEIGGLAQNGLD